MVCTPKRSTNSYLQAVRKTGRQADRGELKRQFPKTDNISMLKKSFHYFVPVHGQHGILTAEQKQEIKFTYCT